jgi:hypothetical protein
MFKTIGAVLTARLVNPLNDPFTELRFVTVNETGVGNKSVDSIFNVDLSVDIYHNVILV